MLLTFLIAIPFLTACFIAMLQKKHLRLIERVVIISSILQLVFSLLLIPVILSEGKINASTFFSLDPFAAFLSFIITLVGLFTAFYSVGYFRTEVLKKIIGPTRVRQFFLLFELFLCAMLLAVSAINPIVMWIAIEATTLSTAFLISFYNKPSATEAAWKYLIINALGLLLGLLGTIIFIAMPHASAGTITWELLKDAATNVSPTVLKIAFVFVFVGYGTKIGLFPFHTWKPDTYSKAPTPVVALFSGVLLNVAFFALLRFKGVVDTGLHSAQFTSSLFIFFGLASLLLAGLLIFIQKNYKRLLAYSSIEHAGLLALGFGFGGFAIFGALLHMLFNALAKALLFFTAGNIFLKYSSTKMKNVSGIMTTQPLTAAVFFAACIAALGFPPFGLFTTEMMMLSSGMERYPYVVALAVLSILVVFFGFFKHLSALFFGKVPEGIESGESNVFTRVPIVFLLSLLLVLSWYLPDSLETLIRLTARDLSINF